MLRTACAVSVSSAPGCAFALTPVVTMYAQVRMPTASSVATSSASVLTNRRPPKNRGCDRYPVLHGRLARSPGRQYIFPRRVTWRITRCRDRWHPQPALSLSAASGCGGVLAERLDAMHRLLAL